MQTQKFLFYASGIFISFFFFGILQEKITKGRYTNEIISETGEKTYVTEKYTYSLSLVFILCLINYIVATIVLYIWPQGEDKTPPIYHTTVAITCLLAMVCSNMALQWVSYPTQAVGKAAKPIPVMILAVFIGNKSYSYKKYFFVSIVVIGITLFMFKEAEIKHSNTNFGLGELLLVMSLTMDGLTGAIQERMRAKAKPTGLQMMKALNGWSVLYLSVALILTWEGMEFVEFVRKYPFVLKNLLALGVTQSIGQLFLYSMVSEFGPLAVSIVTTTRKFFTVLASVVIFGNALTILQWIGTILVFTGLLLDAFFAKSAPKKK